jgi:predicted DNA-binding WGR domain protein
MARLDLHLTPPPLLFRTRNPLALPGFRNLEEYANTGTVGPGRELPFAVQFCTPGWHPLIRDTALLVELRQYFCRVDGEGALLMTKDQFSTSVFSGASNDKGRSLLRRDLKKNVKGLKGQLLQAVFKPLEDGHDLFLSEVAEREEMRGLGARHPGGAENTWRLEHTKDGGVFWSVKLSKKTTRVKWGAIGDSGHVSEKEHKTKAEAKQFVDEKVDEKIAGGYVEADEEDEEDEEDEDEDDY